MDIVSYMLGKKSGGGNTGALVPIVVQELPSSGEEGKLYLVPRQVSETNNVFDEYIWVENDFELIGTAEIDISGKQDKFQFATLPNATSTNVGQIVQYIGQTTASYTNGYFYICVSDGQATPTYSWVNLNVQPAPDMSNYLAKNNTTSYTPTNDYNPATKKYVDDNAYKQVFTWSTDTNFMYVSAGTTGHKSSIYPETSENQITLSDFIKDAYNYAKNTGNPIVIALIIQYEVFVATISHKDSGSEGTIYLCGYDKRICIKVSLSNHLANYVSSVNKEYISSNYLSKTNTTSYTPTNNYNPATKKYVDDTVNNNKFDATTIPGYDASATQVLKNVNGTLTWVEDIQQVINGEVSDGGEVVGDDNNQNEISDGGEVDGNEPDPDNNEEQNE